MSKRRDELTAELSKQKAVLVHIESILDEERRRLRVLSEVLARGRENVGRLLALIEQEGRKGKKGKRHG